MLLIVNIQYDADITRNLYIKAITIKDDHDCSPSEGNRSL